MRLRVVLQKVAPTMPWALFVFLLDQLFKYFVLRSLGFTGERQFGAALIAPLLNADLGLSLPAAGAIIAILIVLALAFISWLWWHLPQRWYTPIAFAFVWGGSIANIVDRLRFGGVVDYVHIWILPIFNIADLFITAGLITFVVVALQTTPRTQALH